MKNFLSILVMTFSGLAFATPLLNEIYVGDSSLGYANNYVEIIGNSGESLNGYSLLQFDGTGALISSVTLNGESTNMNPTIDGKGFFVQVGAASEQAGTWMLVTGWDWVADIDFNNDGMIDGIPPWDTLVDSVGWGTPGGSEFLYTTVDLAPIGGHAISTADRLVGSVDANNTGSWFYGATTFDGNTYDAHFILSQSSANTPIGGTDPIAHTTVRTINYPDDPIGCPEPSSLLFSALLAGAGVFYRRKSVGAPSTC